MESKKDFRVGEWLVRRQLNTIENGSEVRTIEPKVMEVLAYLAEHAGEVLPKERIIRAVWPNTFVSDEVLTYSISELRKAFEDDAKDPRFIQTIPQQPPVEARNLVLVLNWFEELTRLVPTSELP